MPQEVVLSVKSSILIILYDVLVIEPRKTVKMRLTTAGSSVIIIKREYAA